MAETRAGNVWGTCHKVFEIGIGLIHEHAAVRASYLVAAADLQGHELLPVWEIPQVTHLLLCPGPVVAGFLAICILQSQKDICHDMHYPACLQRAQPHLAWMTP